MRHCAYLTLFSLCVLAGCSSTQSKTGTSTTQTRASNRVSSSSNPVAKYIELVGVRITETKPGTLQVKFAVVNHSDADVGNIEMNVNLRPTTAKPEDPPLASFKARVDGLGPEDLKEVTVDVPTKLRAYELPDWQFLTTDFEITEPK